MHLAQREHIISWYLCLGLVLGSCYSITDSLKQGYQLNDGEYLVSAGKVFTLGFFVPKQQTTVGYFTPESVENCYIGIWYTYDEDKKPVWVANRNRPISKGSGALVIDRNGDLKILHKGLTTIVLTSSQGITRKTVAVLTDNGNFVLRELNLEKVLWQSFDYPTDTLLPGMRLGFNMKTGQNWSITSWVNDQVPALGPFTLGTDPNGTNQLIMWRRGKIHWSSGIWNDSKFENLNDNLYSFDYVSNEDERYFTLSLVHNWHISFPMYQISGQGIISKLDFSRWGSVGLFLFSLVDCKNISHQLALGCVEKQLPECRNKHRFEKTKGYVVSEGFKYEEQNYILGVADCEAKCLTNCSCVAYASIYSNGTGCQFWSDITHLVVDEDEFVVSYYRELYIQTEYRLRVQPQQIFWWIWLIVGTAALLLLLPFAWLGYRVKKSLLKITHCFVQCFSVLGFIVRQILKKYILRLYYNVQRSLEEETRQMEEEILPSELDSSVDQNRLLNLVGYAWELSAENRGSELIDQTLILDGEDHAEAMRCINVGLLCVQDHPEDRPTMSTVVAMISNETSELPEPKKPAFFIGQDSTQGEHLQHDLEQGSLNDASITEMEAR
ncbi:hypothetical protein SOVF_028770 [Spinacia oleracea]|nr:hypothetical protein SOVF_028770 [Spinacia oleracea]